MIGVLGVTSSQDLDLVQSQQRTTLEIVTGPERLHVVVVTIARPRQIVTIIVAARRRFCASWLLIAVHKRSEVESKVFAQCPP
jgi:hypothetical protein